MLMTQIKSNSINSAPGAYRVLMKLMYYYVVVKPASLFRFFKSTQYSDLSQAVSVDFGQDARRIVGSHSGNILYYTTIPYYTIQLLDMAIL